MSALPCLFIVQQDQSNKRSWSRIFLFSTSGKLYCDRLYMCILIHVFSSCLLLVVYLKSVRFVFALCVLYIHCLLLRLLLSISDILKVFAFVASCFQGNDTRSFRVTICICWWTVYIHTSIFWKHSIFFLILRGMEFKEIYS